MSDKSSLVVYAKKTRSDNVIDPSCTVHGRVGWVSGANGRDEYIYDRDHGFVPRKQFFAIKEGRASANRKKHAEVPFGAKHRAERRAHESGGPSGSPGDTSPRLLRPYGHLRAATA